MCYTTLRTKNGKGTYIMAHEVEMIDGVAQMAFVGRYTLAWSWYSSS